MATTITLPDAIVYDEIETGDTVEFLEKFNAFQLQMSGFGPQLGQTVEEIEAAFNATLEAAEQIKTDTQAIYDEQVLPARNETKNLRNQTQILRDETAQIAAGDVALTDLQPGTLTQPGDYAGVDGSGNVVVRNVNADTLAQAHAVALSF